tara:strand:- start:9261 stop:10664 length:1404 start_codon:yes stop_codon:yes gene_type:complete
MGSEKNLTSIANIALEMGDAPFGSNLKTSDYTMSGALVVQGKNIAGRVFDWTTKRHISIEKYESIKRSHCFEGDLIFPKVGTIGKVGRLSPCLGYDKYILSTNTMRLRVDPKKANPLFVYYYFTWERTVNLIHAMNSKSVQPVFNFTSLKKFPIELPSTEKQDFAALVLDSLDKKIELNQKTNQTLEKMAQALFKSWFVDFDPVIDNALMARNPIPEELQARAELRQRVIAERATNPKLKPLPDDIQQLFPSEFEESELGWIPKGWEVTSFESLISLIGGGTPKTTIDDYWGGDIPWFSVVDAPNDSDVFVIDTEKHVTQLGVDKSSTKILREGTTIISARGTVGKCALVGSLMAMNQSCYGIVGKSENHDEYIYFLTRYQVSDLQKRGHGSVFNTITRETFKSISLAKSSDLLTQKFSEMVRPYLTKILSNNKQNIELTKLRDVLLPKLISGEIQLDSRAQELMDA